MTNHLSAYPLLFKYLTDNGDPAQLENKSTKRLLERLDEALGVWSKGMSEGSIENARLVETKDVISRAIGSVWQEVPRDNEYLRSLPDAQYNAVSAPNSDAPATPIRPELTRPSGGQKMGGF